MEQIKNKRNVMLDTLQEPGFDRVLVACHRSPDGDACGSAHALVWALRKMGKQAKVYCPDPFGKEFSYLTRREAEMPDFEAEHFITVDVASPEMLCDAPFLSRIEICLDHHRINTVAAPLRWIEPEYASCGELVLELIHALEIPLDAEIAKAIYTAIATDTGLFRFSNTTEKTLLAAASLFPFVEPGEFYRINKILFETKTMKELSLESFAIQNVAFAAEGAIAYLTVDRACREELGADYEELSDLIQVIRRIEGVRVAIVAKEREDGVFKVSVRAEEGVDASALCAAFGGGGHFAAAGCTLLGTASEITKRLIAEAEGRLS